jgi:hypothetical protein
MTGEPTNELIARLRSALGAGERLVPGTMSEQEHEGLWALAALAALAARVTELKAEVERGTRIYVTCHENRMAETARADKAEARVTELAEVLRRIERGYPLTPYPTPDQPYQAETLSAIARAALAAAGEGEAT